MISFNRYHTEIAELYWLTEYLDYSNLSFPTITSQTIARWLSSHD
jgi:hypothetical protein